MKFLFWVIVASLQALSGYSQPDRNSHKVFLISNLADIPHHHSYWEHLQQLLSSQSGPVALLVNGDILTKPFDPVNQDDLSRIDNLLGLAGDLPHVPVILIPGDRDWDNSGKGGLESVNDLEDHFKDRAPPNVTWAIKNGCPGPQDIQIGSTLTIVAVNTQWFNHPYQKPLPEDGTCKVPSLGEFLEELEEIVDEEQGRNILIAGHFPVLSLGRSGGHYPLGKYVLPVPVVSGMPIAYHQNVGTPRDISNEHFDDYKNAIHNFLLDHHSLVYASGHDADLQILDFNRNYLVNSGASVNGHFVSQSRDALYTSSQPGLIAINYGAEGQITADVFLLASGGFAEIKSIEMAESGCLPSTGTRPANTAFVPCRDAVPVLGSMSGSYPDSTVATAGPEYQARGLKTAFLGKHYRTSWSQPVTVPILNLDTVYGGLIPIERGGGRQTKSVKLAAANGRQYVFRSVNKDPVKALPYELRETFVVDVLRDQTSTQHPYGALVAAPLLDQIDVLHASPRLFLMPDDAKLGPFQPDYGNLMGMIEERPVNPKNVKVPFESADKIQRSVQLFREMYEDNENQVAVDEFVRARVFDILVGDWGKHEDNWKWAGYKTDNKTIYRPIPRDRDHVFSRWDGLLPWLVDREWAKPSGENFGHELKGLRSLMWQARHLDRFLASSADGSDWVAQAKQIQESVSDQDIEAAVRSMPGEMYMVSGKEIIAKLQQRKEDLVEYASRYYKMLAREVDVVGSNKKEYFQISRLDDSRVQVDVFDTKEPVSGTTPLYSRTFEASETKEIRMFGMGGSDRFEFKGDSPNSIKTRIIGGPGSDEVEDLSPGSGGKKILVYERSSKAAIALGPNGKRVESRNESLYRYDRTRFAYNTYLPYSYFSYNTDNGFQLNLGVSFTQHRYDKEDFSTRHSFSGKATTAGNFAFDYHSRFHHAIGTWDLLTIAHVGLPNDFTNFFGFGNETVKIDSLQDRKFYRSRYNSYEAGLGLGKQFWKVSHFGLTANYENNEGNLEAGTVLEPTSILGKDPLNLVESKAILNLDLRDSRHLPTRGIRIYADQSYGIITTGNQTDYGVTNGWVEVYSSVNENNPVTLGLVGGGALSFGNLPFYKAVNLGQNNHLRGYRSNRFSGERAFFFNSDLRVQLGHSKTALFPLKYGVNGFYDLGKVFIDGEVSRTWHRGYGGGFYLIPIEERFVFALNAAFSVEETALILFRFGRLF